MLLTENTVNGLSDSIDEDIALARTGIDRALSPAILQY